MTAAPQDTAPTPPPRRASQIPGVLLGAWALFMVAFFFWQQGGAYAIVAQSAIQGPWRVFWDDVPWVALAGAGYTAVFCYLLGALVLGCFRIYLPTVVRAGLAMALGMGFGSFAMSMLAMVHVLTPAATLAAWIVMFLVAALARAKVMHDDNREARFNHGLSGEAMMAGRHLDYLEWRNATEQRPQGFLLKGLYFVMIGIIGVISALMFAHGLGVAETYWDSLILYLGYARMTAEAGGFPTRIVGQVGIGLGANYPHAFEGLAAGTAALATVPKWLLSGGATTAIAWHDMHGQWIAPTAALAAMALIYGIALDLTRERLAAVAITLAIRAIPYGMSYSQFASSYALAILVTAAFALCAIRLVEENRREWVALMLMVAGFGPNVNYLMLAMGGAAVVALVASARWKPAKMEPTRRELITMADDATLDDSRDANRHHDARALEPPAFLVVRHRVTVLQLLRDPHLWLWLGVALLVAAPWYVRNAILTGNPVYAFYANIIPSLRVNPDVMNSAIVEWKLNGDGLARAGSTLTEKLANTIPYYITGPQHWKVSPFFGALLAPGLLILVGTVVAVAFRFVFARTTPPRADAPLAHLLRIAAGPIALMLVFIAYAYVVADYYLYQIISVLPLLAIPAAAVFVLAGSGRAYRPWSVALLTSACLAMGLGPGLFMGAMGFKIKRAHPLLTADQPPQLTLMPLRNLFMPTVRAWTIEYGGDYQMAEYLNKFHDRARVLSHENRHLMFHNITIAHLDDWEMQEVYGKDAATRMARLDELKLGLYLYVPNEDKHRVNARLGMDELIGLGYFEPIHETAAAGGSTREELGPGAGTFAAPLNYKNIPPNKNILYKRTRKAPATQ